MAGERLKKAMKNGHGGKWELEFPTKYVRGVELDGRDVNLTIHDIEPGHELKGRNGETDTGLVLYFEETEKMLVLNKTNAQSIAKLHGGELKDWIGKRVTLYPAQVQAFGDTHEAVRVRPKAPPAKQSEAA
jgi:hypothetical protein